MSQNSKHGSADVNYILQHRLAIYTDALLGALMRIKPADPVKYFNAAHKLLQYDYEAAYALWQEQTPSRQGSGVSAEPDEVKGAENDLPPPSSFFQLDPTLPFVGLPRVEGQGCVLYGADQMEPRYQVVVSEAALYDRSYPATCGEQTFSLKNAVHYHFRLASLFLHKIGRVTGVMDEVMSSRGQHNYKNKNEITQDGAQLPGLPNVKLMDAFSTCPTAGQTPGTPSTGDIVISAAELDRMCVKLYGRERMLWELQEWRGWTSDGRRLEKGLQVDGCAAIFGAKEFRVSWQEVCRLADTTKFYTGVDLPPKFFLRLVGIISRDPLVEYYNTRKSVPLVWLTTEHSDRQLCDVGHFIRDLLSDPKQQEGYGFRSTEHFKQTIQQSLVELSSQVCVAGQGYFFVGNYNQIQEKTRYPVTFLSTPSIDFKASAAGSTERNKYFLSDKFREGGQEAFKARVKRTYHMMFTACKDNGVTHPTALPWGLGSSMPAIDQEQDNVRRIYHQAQFELLSEVDYGFDTYFINPSLAINIAKQVLDNGPYRLKCQVVIHKKDCMALASRLAREGYRTSLFYPSDCIAVMQGCVGYWWECGMGERFYWEEYLVATTTAILQRANVCPLWRAHDRQDVDRCIEEKRVIQVLLPDGQRAAEMEERAFGKVDSHQQVGWRAYPTELVPLPNPSVPCGFTHYYEGTPLGYFRILWVGTNKQHRLHLRPMVNQLRQAGIVVDVAHSTVEAKRLLSSDVPVNFVFISPFVTVKPGEEVEQVEDSWHLLLKTLQELECEQSYYFCTICALMTAIDSHDRSLLQSEGCKSVMVDLHIRPFQEVMESLSFVQRHSDRLCHAIASPTLPRHQKRLVVQRLLQFGIDVDFSPKAWAPLHFLARQPEVDEALFRHVLDAKANVDVRTRYATDGILKGATPLQVAVEYANLPAVRLLLAAGAAWCSPLSTVGAMSLTEKQDEALYDPLLGQILAELEAQQVDQVDHAPGPLPTPELLAVLWISTGEQLSSYAHHVRSLVDLCPAIALQTLSCRHIGEDDDSLEAWIEDTLFPFMEDLGTHPASPSHPEPFAWLQCVVLELAEERHLRRWLRLRRAIKGRVKDRQPDHSAPWLKIITYAEGFQMTYEQALARLYLAEDDREDRQNEVICVSGKVRSECPADPRRADCPKEMKVFYEEVCRAVTHWARDVSDQNPVYPHLPYDAKTSHLVEAAYREGAPTCRVTEDDTLFFRDMLQRRVRDEQRPCLVLRYPRPGFDWNLQVRSFPSLLDLIASGNSIVFVGAGFCSPAGGPSWKKLLEMIADEGLEQAKRVAAAVADGDGDGAVGRRGDSKLAAKQLIQQQQQRKKKQKKGQAAEFRTVEEMTELRREVYRLVSNRGDHTQFELAAQLLEDAMPDDMKVYLAEILKRDVKRGGEILKGRLHGQNRNQMGHEVMASRINYLQCLKFSAVLTTNYSRELCVCEQERSTVNEVVGCGVCRGITPLTEDEEPPYLDIVRKLPEELIPMQQRPIIQIHGSVCNPQTIVLSKEGYRTLLHGKPNYRDFLKSVMMTRNILYLGFSFTDDYLNEIRSEVMSMKEHSPETKNLAFAVIHNKSQAHCDYYAQHEGVKFLTWPTADFGYGGMDRYLDSLLNMTDVCAALRDTKVILFSPRDDSSQHGTTHQNLTKLKVELERQKKMTQVFKVMPPGSYREFKVVTAETFWEVEDALKRDDFLQSWVVIFADAGWDCIPMMHRELIHFLQHPQAQRKTFMYPLMLLVWADGKPACMEPIETQGTDKLSLKEQYERNLRIQFCTSLPEVLENFRRVKIAEEDDQEM